MCSPKSLFLRRRRPLHRSSPSIEMELACPTARGAASVPRHLVGKKIILRMTMFMVAKLLLYRSIPASLRPGLFTQKEIDNLRDDDLSKSLASSPKVVEVFVMFCCLIRLVLPMPPDGKRTMDMLFRG